MRDLIWTLIVVWLVWKIYTAFSSGSNKKNGNSNHSHRRKEGEVKIDKNVNQKTHFNSTDGEYVDYEEVK